MLYVNDGRAQLRRRTRAGSGLAAPTAAFTGFGTDWFDYDNDGWLDLFIANGAVNIVEAQRGEPLPFRMRTSCFAIPGTGRFEETSEAGGPAFERAEIGRGAAFGDIDNDGDVDVLVTNNNGPVRLLLNQVGDGGNHWLQVRAAAGAAGTASAFGAWVGVERAGRADASGAASEPTAAICQRATRACTSASARGNAGRGHRPVARRRARTMDECCRRPAGHAAARQREMKVHQGRGCPNRDSLAHGK